MSRHRVIAQARRAAVSSALPLLAALLGGLPALVVTAPVRAAAPSTFSQVVGSALLCRSALDNGYFHAWMRDNFGPAYKQEGGAFWFKVDANLWGAPVQEVMVSDDSSEAVFIAAVIDMAPPKLDDAIRIAAGPRHRPQDSTAYPVRESQPGSHIVYFKDKSKMYCLKYKPLPAPQ